MLPQLCLSYKTHPFATGCPLKHMIVSSSRFHSGRLRGCRCALVLAALACKTAPKEVELLNVSYDPTRELYADYNLAFARHRQAQTGEIVSI